MQLACQESRDQDPAGPATASGEPAESTKGSLLLSYACRVVDIDMSGSNLIACLTCTHFMIAISQI